MSNEIKRLDGLLMTPQDVANELRISTARVRQLEDEGKLPAARTVSGNRIFCKSDVEKYAAKRKS